jgi:hypothetical protein
LENDSIFAFIPPPPDVDYVLEHVLNKDSFAIVNNDPVRSDT